MCHRKWINSLGVKVSLLFAVLFIYSLPIFSQIKSISLLNSGTSIRSVVKFDNLDTTVYAEWVDGKENHLNTRIPKDPILQTPLWTDKTTSYLHGVTYGVSNKMGSRHLRIGFYHFISVGSIIAEGGGKVSVLKPNAPYPGDLNDESQWIPAQRLVNGQLSNKELNRTQCTVWVLPSGTNTRAIRFSHQPDIIDASYSGRLMGAWVTDKRVANIAPSGFITTKSNIASAKMLTNEEIDGGDRWTNIEMTKTPRLDYPILSKDSAEWILLSWPKQVKLGGLALFESGFNVVEVQTFVGSSVDKPQGADESKWKSVAAYYNLSNTMSIFWPNVLDFGQEITTTAIRLKVTSATKGVGNTTGWDLNGRRIWLGEIMALEPIGNNPLLPLSVTTNSITTKKPPIPIVFSIKNAGYVTLVIEDGTGKRVRNLVSDTWFNAGNNTAWWDGLDDLGRDVEAANHGSYTIPAQFVTPGSFKVRGIVHSEIKKTYQASIYSPGNPPWNTDDHIGGWLSNHAPPQSAVFLPAKQSPSRQPALYLGCYIAEGTDGLALVDLDGNKIGGKGAIGGAWTVAPYLARDAGEKADAEVCAYTASVFETGNKTGLAELRLTGLTRGNDKKIINYQLGRLINPKDVWGEIGGLAVDNGVAIISLTNRNQLLFIDVKGGKVLGASALEHPRGLAFDAAGNLLVLSSNKLLHFNLAGNDSLLNKQVLISTGLEAPVGIALDSTGKIYISDGGGCNQVKIFSPKGDFIRAIGKYGAPQAGAYDSLRMNNLAGIAIDSRQHLWITENDFLPKRVSVWSLDGAFIKAFYGPAKYGGGGTLDGVNKNKFYYSEEQGTMEFEINWNTGSSQLKKILYRKTAESLDLGFRGGSPETPIYHNGQRYFTNCFTSNPTYGASVAFLFVERKGILHPAAAMGRAYYWDLLKQERFRSIVPAGVDLYDRLGGNQGFFIWTDLNEDAQVQPNEVTILKGSTGGVTVLNDLSFCLQADGVALQIAPDSFSTTGTPFYKFSNKKILVEGVLPSVSDGGDQLLTASNGWTVAMQGIKPFSKYSICGAKDGKPVWSYPNLWPGLHPAHIAPTPSFPGELTGPTRLLGGLLDFKGAESGPLWAINSDRGMVYVFTTDGLFVTTLFDPMKSNSYWKMPIAKRGMSLDGVRLWEENFWPTITQTLDGDVYMCDGDKTALVKIDGLQTIHRLPEITINVTKEMLEKCLQYQHDIEVIRQKDNSPNALQVMMQTKPIVVDGRFDDWQHATWVDIDKRGGKLPYSITAAMAVYGDRLYVGYQTGNSTLLKNTGEIATAPFKTGGALDLMIRTNAASNQSTPIEGDLRLLVTIINNKRTALLYRAVVPGTKVSEKVPFSSPWRTITFDKVEDVSNQLEFAATKDGNYEISIPLAALQLKPKEGLSIKGDIGILRGDGAQTISRVYWSNKATAIVSDVPSEAELTPALWGTILFENTGK